MGKQYNDIEIKSVAQFVQEVAKICINEYGVKRPYVFFRGEANRDWETMASLLRVDENDPKIQERDVFVRMEYDMISKAKKFYPELFKSCQNSIDRIVEMQHYGLPTRLLDVTGNPLVALYFACDSKIEEAGRVLFTYKEPFDHYCTNIFAALCEYWPDYKSLTVAEKRSMGKPFDYPISEPNESPTVESLLNIIRDYELCKNEDIDEVRNFLFHYLTKSFLYIPHYSNARIKAQRGAFIFSAFMQPGLHSFDYRKIAEEGKKRKLEKNDVSGIYFQKERVSLRDEFDKTQFIIGKDDKNSILKELSLLGIDEAFVYPEPEHQMKTVRDEIAMSYYHQKKNEI